jgi:DNA-binding MarR family transcriptional regulator
MAEAAGMAKQSMSYLVDYLEARGYVTRSPDPADRRAQIIALSERGTAAMAVAHDRLQADEAELVRRFGAERMEAVREVLAVIAPPAFWQEGAAPGLNVHLGSDVEPR